MSLVVGGVEDKSLGFVCFRESETKKKDFAISISSFNRNGVKVTLKQTQKQKTFSPLTYERSVD